MLFVVSLAEIESLLNLHRLFLKSRAGPDPRLTSLHCDMSKGILGKG